jgi:seryl-tRNA synthetase
MNVGVENPVAAIAEGLFHRTGIAGVYIRTERYERVIESLNRAISELREDGTEVLRFPPVMSRRQLDAAGYVRNFPQMLGGVCCLGGHVEASPTPEKASELSRLSSSVADGAAEWDDTIRASELVLTPAACYPVYPLAAGRGKVSRGGIRFDVLSDCFRREPSPYFDRLQSFRMREYVCVGEGADVLAFRERWMPRAKALADRLGLTYHIERASDPFFGRMGKLMALSQIEQALKFELLVPIYSIERPTACMSFNYHMDHFGHAFGLDVEGGGHAHTGCVAFGLDRLALALFVTHGLDFAKWPASTRETLHV